MVSTSNEMALAQRENEMYEGGNSPTGNNVGAARALGMEIVHVGDNPFIAIAELDAILDRRGTRGS